MTQHQEIRSDILRLVGEYFKARWPDRHFVPGETAIPVSGRVFDEAELISLVGTSLDFWLTAGPEAQKCEKRLAEVVGCRHALLTNSGSSANLLAISCLTSPSLGDRALQPGDEVLTVAAGFPTTVAPILQNQLTPVFVDITTPSYNVDLDQLKAAIGPKTRAVILAHSLGNPFPAHEVRALADQHGLWFIEDCCDALGSTIGGRNAGTFGDLATLSFYPAHHITMGEGGCVLTDSSQLKMLVQRFRDWGRDCWCDPGHSNTCGQRFSLQKGTLPKGYDHKYTYSEIGYNLKITDLQASIGLSQLDKLEDFVQARRRNFAYLYKGLSHLREVLILPEASPGTEPSWFGFPLSVRPKAPFTRSELINALEEKKIATRLLFAGNLLRQPAFADCAHRVAGPLTVTDQVVEHMFWIGLYPGLTKPMLDFVISVIDDFVTEAVGQQPKQES